MTESDSESSSPRGWRRWALVAGGIALIALVIVVIVTRESPPQKSPALQARLELAAGDVRVNLGSGSKSAVSGTALVSGATVETGRGARALVRMPDGSMIFLRGDSNVVLDRDALRLVKGEYWLDAPPTDRRALVHRTREVEISAAEAGLSIKRTEKGAIVYVARGTAAVSSKTGRVEVRAGEQATAPDNAAPSVVPVAFWDDWTGGMADLGSNHGRLGAGAGSIYGVDSGGIAGEAARRLEISRQAVHAVVREGLSETEVDQTFFNPGERGVEGWYWFTVPERASVTGFSVETNGSLIEGEFIERREAAAQYAAAKSSGQSPAILEYVDSGTYRARIYPVPPGGTRRVVLRYVELRPSVDNTLEYVYPMGTSEPVRIGEFTLSVDLGDAGKRMKLSTLADARIEQDGRLVTMRRSGYTPRAPFQLEAKLDRARPALTVARFNPGDDSADYVLVRYTPDIDWSSLKEQRADVVVVVDTSAAGDEAARQLKVATAEAILRALSPEDRFALLSLDVRATVLHPAQALAPASDQQIEKALEALADHASGGATDLSAFFDVSLGRLHGTEQPALIYVGDGLATSGELVHEQIVERLRRALSTSRARLFTVAVGTDADFGLLDELARAGGGDSFRLNDSEQTTARALELAAAIKTPTLTDFEIDLGAGLDEVFTNANGKVSRGKEVTVLARTHHEIPRRVKARGRLDAKPFEKEYPAEAENSVLNAFVPRLWAAEYVRRLLGESSGPDAERGRVVKLGVEYGLMTPYTSVLALESESAYQELGIPRRGSRLRGPRLGALTPGVEKSLSSPAQPFSAERVVFGCSRNADLSKGEEAPAVNQPAIGRPVAQPGTPTAAIEQKAAADEAPVNAVAPAPPPESPASLASPVARRAVRASEGSEERDYQFRSGVGSKSAGVTGGGSLGGRGAPKPTTAEPMKQLNAGSDKGRMETDKLKKDQEEQAGAKAPTLMLALGACSDAAGRPLAQRVLLWRQRLRAAKTPSELIERYDSARRACELNDWQAERLFLDLLQQRIDSEGAAEVLLARFADRRDVQKYVAKLILRRTVDARLIAAVERVLYGSAVNWLEADLKLQAIADREERLTRLRELVARAPGDANGAIRLVRLLLELGKKDEALSLGLRLRDEGSVTPQIARQLGDVIGEVGLQDEAIRTYSEIVEFDRDNTASRRLLGDIFLGHGWYDPAYRQYKTLTESNPADALGWLRLAAAAAGAGRTDEALRVERRVASAEGTPGPNDPRRWARLWSAARLAGLLSAPSDKPPAAGDVEQQKRGIERELKELQLFSGPGRLVILTWENLAEDLLLVARAGDKDIALGEMTDAAPAGLSAALLSPADAERVGFVARVRSVPETRSTRLVVYSIHWDSKHFRVDRRERELEARTTEVAL